MASSAEMEGWGVMRPDSQHRVGRRRSTTWDHISNVAIDLFAARGFDEVSVDDVAEAAGIARRTLFRYYPSKNALPWGDFDAHLDHMRDLLNDLEPDVPIGEALRTALLAFNSFDEQETARHRQRMRVILETAALQAYSMTMYAGWRAVVAAFVAQRLGAKAGRPRAADRGVDDARRRAVGLRALAGRRVGFAGAGAGRCVRHGPAGAGRVEATLTTRYSASLGLRDHAPSDERVHRGLVVRDKTVRSNAVATKGLRLAGSVCICESHWCAWNREHADTVGTEVRAQRWSAPEILGEKTCWRH